MGRCRVRARGRARGRAKVENPRPSMTSKRTRRMEF